MPWLKKIDASSVNPENWEAWLSTQTKEHGEYHEVSPIPAEDHANIDPLTEARQMIGDDSKIIVVET